MVIIFGDVFDHHPTAFLASNLMGSIAIDPTKTSTSTSDANYVTSSDISDNRYLCDTPMSSAASGSCSCGTGTAGLVGDAGRVFPGSAVGAGGAQTAVVGPLGIQGAVSGVPHPSFRFAQKVTDVAVNMTDITSPGQERLVWDAKFRLTGPDGSLGSDYLPSSLPPIGGEVQSFHKLCSALNSFRLFKLKVLAGGDAPIDQSMVMKATIVQPPELLDPNAAPAGAAPDAAGGDKVVSSLKATGDRMYAVDGNGQPVPPMADSVGPIRASSFAQHHDTSFSQHSTSFGRNVDIYRAVGGGVTVQPERSGVPAVTATSFAGEDGGCSCGGDSDPPPLTNPPNCHKPPTVTIHMPNQMTRFL